MKYFVKLRDFPDAPDVGRPLVVARITDDIAEKFDHAGRRWVADPDILWRVMGMGGDADFRPISASQAKGYMDEIRGRQKGGPGSGHAGHRGRPGLRGGSLPRGATARRPDKPMPMSNIIYEGETIPFEIRADMRDDFWSRIDADWPPEGAEYGRAGRARWIGHNALRDFVSGDTLLVRTDKGEIVGVASIEIWDEQFLHLNNIATKEKGNGTIMMIEVARYAVSKGKGLTGHAVQSAVDFYTGLANAMGASITEDDGDIIIEYGDLLLMLEPLADLKGADEAYEFVTQFMQDEPDVEGWFFTDEEKGGEGSGHPGHAGRPGRRGGSLPRGASFPVTTRWHGRRTRGRRRDQLSNRLRKEIDETWPTENDIEQESGESDHEYLQRQRRAHMARAIGRGAVNDFMLGERDPVDLIVRRERGQLVGVGTLNYNSDFGDKYADVMHLATREKGNGSIMMIEMARRAVAKGVGLAGGAIYSAEAFYRGLADAMQVGHLIIGTGSSMMIPYRALVKMLEPLEDLKQKGKSEALEFVMNFIEEEEDFGAWFGPEVKGGEGSGHPDHRGRPGLRGGSLPRGGGFPVRSTWYGTRTRFKKRRELSKRVRDEIYDVWPDPHDMEQEQGESYDDYWKRRQRADEARSIAASAVEAFTVGRPGDGRHLLVRRELGELVGVAQINAQDYDDKIYLSWLATREKGNGAIMMIEVARKAVELDKGLRGTATSVSETFYTQLAASMGIDISGRGLEIEHHELVRMLEPLKDLKHLKGKNPALDFVIQFMENEDEVGAWFGDVEEKGGAGSGHHGHVGRPGEVGGSLPRGATGFVHERQSVTAPNVDPERVRIGRDLMFEIRNNWHPEFTGYGENWKTNPEAENQQRRYNVGMATADDFAYLPAGEDYPVILHTLRDEEDDLVGIMTMQARPSGRDPSVPASMGLRYVATREKGNGTILMIHAAREARDAGLDLYGTATQTAYTFYAELAKAMGVGDGIIRSDSSTVTELLVKHDALVKMLEPFEELKDMMRWLREWEDEDDEGIYFVLDDSFAHE